MFPTFSKPISKRNMGFNYLNIKLKKINLKIKVDNNKTNVVSLFSIKLF
jgi:hypothetical protein